MTFDAQGYVVSGATSASSIAHDLGVRALCLAHGSPAGHVDQAIKMSPDFVMAQLTKAWMLTLPHDPSFVGTARSIVNSARSMVMNEREEAHCAALNLAISGSRRAAVTLLDRHLMSYPRDVMAHMAAAYLDVYLGRTHLLRDRVGRALRSWTSDMPDYGIMLAFHGFGFEEAGDYERGEEISREAAFLEPHSWFAHHTVAHVMEMTGRAEDGLGWMAAREAQWATTESGSQCHIWWHKSLYHLELGQFAEALTLYDGPMLRTMRPVGTALCNHAALLWRLDTLGYDVGKRWKDLLPAWDGHADGQCLMFTDMHAAMVELRSGNEALVERRLGWMRATAASATEGAAIYGDVGVPLVEGLMAFHQGAYERAVALLHPIRFDLWQIGGSHAQRDIVDWTLTEAAIRGGLRDVAVALTYERLGTRPRSAVNRRFQRASAGMSA